MATTSEIIGSRIRALRAARGWSLEELSDRCGVRFETVSRVERGVQEPTLGTLERLCGPLGVTLRELLPDDDGSRPTDEQVAAVVGQLRDMSASQFLVAQEIIAILAR